MVMALGMAAAPAMAASTMCNDINSRYANETLPPGSYPADVTYTPEDMLLGDVITVTVTATPPNSRGRVIVNSITDMMQPHSPESLDGYVTLYAPGAQTVTVVDVDTAMGVRFLIDNQSDAQGDLQFSVSCTSPSSGGGSTPASTPTETIINTVQQTHTALVSKSLSTPGLQQRLGMGSGSSPGTLAVTPRDNSAALNFATSLVELQAWGAAGDAASVLAEADPLDQPFNLWIDGSGTLHARSSAGVDYWGSFGVVSAGADYLVSRDLLIGVALHGDMMRDISATTSVNGKGLMAGPYISAEITDNVFLDLAGYYGKSWNDVTSGLFSGTFDTQRLLGSARLEGDIALTEQLTLSPNATAFYLRETAGNYTLADGAGGTQSVSGFDASQLRLSAGGELAYRMDMDDGSSFTPSIAADLGLTLEGGNRHAFTTVGTGFTYRTSGSATLGAEVEAALDSTSFRSVTARSSARVSY